MKRKIEIIMEIKDDVAQLQILNDGKKIPHLYGFNLDYNSRTGEISFIGKRLATDRYGQYFVDETTKDTAIEEVNLMGIFSDKGTINENITDMKKNCEWALNNVRQTTIFNAKKMIQQRLG